MLKYGGVIRRFMSLLDDRNKRILSELSTAARISNAELSRRVDLAQSAVYERVRKLEEAGIIKGYEARLDPKALGFGILAFVAVRTRTGIKRDAAARSISVIPGVQEVHHVAGEECFLVKVRARDTDHLGELLEDKFHAIEGVEATRSTIVLGTVHETSALPTGAPRLMPRLIQGARRG